MPFQVLIAQPHSSSTQFLLNLFREQGHQVRHAPTLAEALSLLEEAQPELVVVDLHSTGQGWSDLLERCRHTAPSKILFYQRLPRSQQERLGQEERYGTPLFSAPLHPHRAGAGSRRWSTRAGQSASCFRSRSGQIATGPFPGTDKPYVLLARWSCFAAVALWSESRVVLYH